MIERIEIEVSQHCGGDGCPLRDSVDLLVTVRTAHGIVQEKKAIWAVEAQIRGWFNLTWEHLGERLKRELLAQLNEAKETAK